jgi:transcription initiation factor IIE alpha subunit
MKGKEVSVDLAWAIVRMAAVIGRDEIEAFTGISKRQIRRILSRWRSTGDVSKQKDRHTLGRPRHLTPEDVAVRTWLLEPALVN